MSDITKLMSTLDDLEAKVNDFANSGDAEKQAREEGEAAVKLQIEELRTQHQELAEQAKKVVPSTEREINASFGKQILDIAKGKAASEGTDTAGGYVVEDQTVRSIRSIQNQYGTARQLFGASIIPMASDVLRVPVDTFEDTSGNAPEPATVSENAAIDESDDAKLGLVTLTAQKYGTLNYVAQELVDDAFVDFIGGYLIPKIGRRFGYIEDGVVLVSGILGSSNVRALTMDTGDTTFQNITDEYLNLMEDEVVDDALNDARYIMHRSIFTILRNLKGSDGHPIWAPMSAGEPPTIKGYPYARGSRLPARSASAVDTAFAMFGDITIGSVFGERLQRKIAVSDQYRFNQDQLAVRVTERIAWGDNSDIGRAICVLKTAAS